MKRRDSGRKTILLKYFKSISRKVREVAVEHTRNGRIISVLKLGVGIV
jgi:hypothetical protein